MRHATIAAWTRHEDGGYGADLDGWSLRVAWHPEGNPDYGGQRGFTWTAERGGRTLVGSDLHEEMEVAMAEAEERTAPAPAGIAHEAVAPGPSETHGHH